MICDLCSDVVDNNEYSICNECMRYIIDIKINDVHRKFQINNVLGVYP